MTLKVSRTSPGIVSKRAFGGDVRGVAKTGMVQRAGPVFPQRALTIEEFPELFTVVSP